MIYIKDVRYKIVYMYVINGSDRLPNVLARTGSGSGTMVDLSGKECCHHLPSQTISKII